jgi:hypothetical protein
VLGVQGRNTSDQEEGTAAGCGRVLGKSETRSKSQELEAKS